MSICSYQSFMLFCIQTSSRFHVPTSSLVHALFLYLLPLSGTHFLTAFASVNLLTTFEVVKTSFSSDILWHPHQPSTSPVQVIAWKYSSPKWPVMCRAGRTTLLTHSYSVLDFWCFTNSFIVIYSQRHQSSKLVCMSCTDITELVTSDNTSASLTAASAASSSSDESSDDKNTNKLYTKIDWY